MFEVNCVSITQPIEFDDPEHLISYCARVSNPENQTNFDTSEKLLSYCMRKKHWSIFEMIDVTFEVQTTRDIGRQLLRHDMQFQEFSQRYAEVDVNSFVMRECRLQDKKNRQNSLVTTDQDLIDGWNIWQKKVAETAAKAYQWAINNGIAKEQARAVLPEGMTPSVLYAKTSLRNWIHYVDVRSDVSTQREHRDIANEVKIFLMEHFKFLKEYWNDEKE